MPLAPFAPHSTYRGDYYASGNEITFTPTGVLFKFPVGYTISGAEVVDNHWRNPFWPSGDVVVTDCNDPQLHSLTTIAGSLIVRKVSLCTQLILPNLEIVERFGGR